MMPKHEEEEAITDTDTRLGGSPQIVEQGAGLHEYLQVSNRPPTYAPADPPILRDL